MYGGGVLEIFCFLVVVEVVKKVSKLKVIYNFDIDFFFYLNLY